MFSGSIRNMEACLPRRSSCHWRWSSVKGSNRLLAAMSRQLGMIFRPTSFTNCIDIVTLSGLVSMSLGRAWFATVHRYSKASAVLQSITELPPQHHCDALSPWRHPHGTAREASTSPVEVRSPAQHRTACLQPPGRRRICRRCRGVHCVPAAKSTGRTLTKAQRLRLERGCRQQACGKPIVPVTWEANRFADIAGPMVHAGRPE